MHAQTLAVYRLLDELRAEHPTLEIESCSSGGARVDLGILERTDRVWVSDVIDPLERQQMLRWTSQLVPPEYLGRTSPAGGPTRPDAGTTCRSERGPPCSDTSASSGTSRTADEETLDDIAEWVTFYKEHRHLLLGGDLVRVDSGDANVLVHGVVAPDRSEAIFALATVGNPLHSPGPRVRFTGLDATTRYWVRPVVVGEPPSGLVAPAWWGEPEARPDQGDARPHSMDHARTVVRGSGYPGTLLSGAALSRVGTTPPVLHPDQVVLFHCRAEAGSSWAPPIAAGT